MIKPSACPAVFTLNSSTASHLFGFGGKPAGLLYGTEQEEGAVLPERADTKIFRASGDSRWWKEWKTSNMAVLFRKKKGREKKTKLVGNVLAILLMKHMNQIVTSCQLWRWLSTLCSSFSGAEDRLTEVTWQASVCGSVCLVSDVLSEHRKSYSTAPHPSEVVSQLFW